MREIVLEIKIWLSGQMIYAQTRISPRKSKGFEIQRDYPIPTRKPDFVLINKKKEFVISWIFPL